MKPETGRNKSFLKVIEILEKEYNEPITIVETGCIRNVTDESKFGDGWSTLNWEYYAKKTNSNVFVVDINEHHINQSKKIVPESDLVKYGLDDSVNYLKTFNGSIDLLFLDSYDYCGTEENIRKCHEHSLNEVKAAWDKLNDKCFILIDDVFNNTHWHGKGELSIPYLLDNGFSVAYYIDSQVLLRRDRKKEIVDIKVENSNFVNLNRHELIDYLNLSGLGIEIGVQKGEYAREILSRSNLHLILLDSWRYIPDGYENDGANTSTHNHIINLNETINNLKKHENRYTLIRELSEVAVEFFYDEMFDFIYLDANHTHSFLKKQLNEWWCKLKQGGVMAGHDYFNSWDVNGISVKKVVDEFFNKKNIKVNECDIGCCSTWFVYKK